MKGLFILLILTSLLSCKYEENISSLTVKAAAFECEEANIHLEIIDSFFKEEIGDPILPICEDNQVYTDLFYSMKHSDSLNTFRIKGYFSLKGHNEFNYGCLGAKYLKVIDVEKIKIH